MSAAATECQNNTGMCFSTFIQISPYNFRRRRQWGWFQCLDVYFLKIMLHVKFDLFGSLLFHWLLFPKLNVKFFYCFTWGKHHKSCVYSGNSVMVYYIKTVELCVCPICRPESLPARSSTGQKQSFPGTLGLRHGCPGRSCRDLWPLVPQPSGSWWGRQSWWASAQTFSL